MMAFENPTNHYQKKNHKTAKQQQKDNRDMTFDKLGCLVSLFSQLCEENSHQIWRLKLGTHFLELS